MLTLFERRNMQSFPWAWPLGVDEQDLFTQRFPITKLRVIRYVFFIFICFYAYVNGNSQES